MKHKLAKIILALQWWNKKYRRAKESFECEKKNFERARKCFQCQKESFECAKKGFAHQKKNFAHSNLTFAHCFYIKNHIRDCGQEVTHSVF